MILQVAKRIANVRFTADKHSHASSVRSTKRWVRGDAYVRFIADKHFHNVSGNKESRAGRKLWKMLISPGLRQNCVDKAEGKAGKTGKTGKTGTGKGEQI